MPVLLGLNVEAETQILNFVYCAGIGCKDLEPDLTR